MCREKLSSWSRIIPKSRIPNPPSYDVAKIMKSLKLHTQSIKPHYLSIALTNLNEGLVQGPCTVTVPKEEEEEKEEV